MKGILRKRRSRIAAIVVLLTAAGLAYWFWPRRYGLTVSPETTVLLRPLNADGTVDYLSALKMRYYGGVAPEDNAAVLLIRALGPEIYNPQVRDRALSRLGMAPAAPGGSYLVDIDDYLRTLTPEQAARYAFSDGADGGSTAPAASPPLPPRINPYVLVNAHLFLNTAVADVWTSAQLPLVADWLKASEEPLSLIAAAARKPRYLGPLVAMGAPSLNHLCLPSFSKHRIAVRALVARSMLRAGDGRAAEACADLLTIHRLARLLGQDAHLLGRMAGLAFESLACQSNNTLALHGNLPAEQLEKFLAELKALPPMPGVVDSIDILERFSSLDAVGEMARRSWSGRRDRIDFTAFPTLDAALSRVNVEWDEALRGINHWWDMQVAAMRTEPLASRRQACLSFRAAHKAFTAKNLRSGPRGWLYRTLRIEPSPFTGRTVDGVVAAMAQDLTDTQAVSDVATMYFELTKVAVALAARKARTGSYPATLAELEPEYFQRVTQDMFADAPLIYRRTEAGYILYSVGADLTDSQGNNSKMADIVIEAK